VFHVCVSSLGVVVLERIVNLIFLWSDFELQKSLQKIVFIKNSFCLLYLCKSFKFQFVTFYWTIYGLIVDLSMSDFFLDFCCFSLFIILTTWKIYIFTFCFCFWNEIISVLSFNHCWFVNEWVILFYEL
jgi:hypothetical protein